MTVFETTKSKLYKDAIQHLRLIDNSEHGYSANEVLEAICVALEPRIIALEKRKAPEIYERDKGDSA